MKKIRFTFDIAINTEKFISLWEQNIYTDY